ncbi:hypothetical protein DXG03_005811 [Asterophora parasitica]|uniref:Uncharacterized protein n=1 Tax=Asterophora parasitica TaxID=117018 RepID=A0A9P7KBB1_9AGAR|nr:hypothetical protein DXG03_005811 [Asterophora parasitica]
MSYDSQLDLLTNLFTAAPLGGTCELMAQGLCENAASLEPWFQATSDHPVVKEVILKVQDASAHFYSAINASKEEALQGYKLMQDVSTLLVYLRDVKTSPEDLEEYVQCMANRAGRARKSAERARLQFSETRKGIFEVGMYSQPLFKRQSDLPFPSKITNQIPAEVAGLADEERRVMKKVAAGEKELQTLKVVKSCTMAGAAVVAAVSIVVFPPALLFLPVALPLLTLVVEAREVHLAKKIEKREKKVYELRDAIAQVEHVAERLQMLGTVIDASVTFWSRTETTLEILVGGVGELRENKLLKLRLSTVEKTCEQVGTMLLNYYDKVKNLELYMPAAFKGPSQTDADVPAADDAISVSSDSIVTLRRQKALKRRESDSLIHSIGVITSTIVASPDSSSQNDRPPRSTSSEFSDLSTLASLHRRSPSPGKAHRKSRNSYSDLPAQKVQPSTATPARESHRDKRRSLHYSPRRPDLSTRSRSPAISPPPSSSGRRGSRTTHKSRDSECPPDRRKSRSPAPSSSRRSDAVTIMVHHAPMVMQSSRRGSDDRRR